MNELTRRRNKKSAKERWSIFYHDVQVGSIGQQSGVPNSVDQWGWSCGFFPGTDARDHRHGTAPDFERARAAFDAAWRELLPKCTEAGFQEWRYQQAATAWKYAMWDAGCKMPTQTVDGWTKCFCGVPIDNKSSHDHSIRCHMERAAA